MFERLLKYVKANAIAFFWAIVSAPIVGWAGEQLSEISRHAIYGWILDRARDLFAEQEARVIAAAASYAPGIVTAAIVFVAVFWIIHRAAHGKRPIPVKAPPSLASEKTSRTEGMSFREIQAIGDQAAAMREHTAELREHRIINVSNENKSSALVENEHRLGLEKVFSVDEDECYITLKFFPDTIDKRGDAVLAILFGYLTLLSVDSVHQSEVNSSIDRLLFHAPNSPLTLVERFGEFVSLTKDVNDFGRTIMVSGYVIRNRLSEGGYYKLTDKGTKKAAAIVDDMIARA